MTTPEGKVKQWLAYRMAKRFGHLAMWEYAPPGGPFGQNGTADRLYLIESGNETVEHLYEEHGRPTGVLVLIEAKAVYANGVANQPTSLQLKRLREIDKAGGVAATLIGKDLAKLDRIFQEIDRRRDLNRGAWLLSIQNAEYISALMDYAKNTPNDYLKDLKWGSV